MKVGDYVYWNGFCDMVIKVNNTKCTSMPTTRVRAISEDGLYLWVNWCSHKIPVDKVVPVELEAGDKKFWESYTFETTQIFEDREYLFINKEIKE